MKNLFALLLLLVSTSTFAQLNSFSIGVDGGILFSEYAQSRTGNPGVSQAFRLELPIGNFAISTGIEKTNFGKQYNYKDMRQGTADDPSYPVLDVTSFNYTYVSIPVRLKYNYRMLYAQVGVRAEMFKKGSITNEGTMYDPYYLEKPNMDVEDIRQNNISTEFALGFNYIPKKGNWGLYFEPTVTYMTKSIYENAELANNQLSYGLKVGAKYTFRNLGTRKI